MSIVSNIDIDLSSWQSEGLLHVPSFFSVDLVGDLNNRINAIWQERPRGIVVDKQVTPEDYHPLRSLLDQLSDEELIRNRFVINNLYLTEEKFRSILCSPELYAVIRNLVDFQPVLTQSLYYEVGTQQGLHSESIFVTPKTPGALVCAWIALEDVTIDNGPIEYFPGSHTIKAYEFSGASYHMNPTEMDDWHAYMQNELQQRAITSKQVLVSQGDLLLMHANLLWQESKLKNSKLTRKSVLAHYQSEADIKKHFLARFKIKGRPYSWLDRKSA